MRGLACLAAGRGIRGTARGFAIAPPTVLPWLLEATEQLATVAAYCLNALQINQVQLDALDAVLGAVREGAVSEAEAVERLARAPHGGWTAIDPASKVLLSGPAGARTWAMAQAGLQQIAPLGAPGGMPLLVSDGYRHYRPASGSHFGSGGQPPRRQDTGPTPTPRWMPRPGLRYAQVVTRMRRRRLVEGQYRGVCGTQNEVEKVLVVCGWQINTAFVERLNLSLRQRVAATRRRSATPGKSGAGWSQQRVLCQVAHHVVLPPTSFRQALTEPLPTNGSGAAQVWRPRTPAAIAGVPDHVWALTEGLR